MKDILYSPTKIIRRSYPSYQIKETSYRFPANITTMTSQDNVLSFHQGYQLHALDFSLSLKKGSEDTSIILKTEANAFLTKWGLISYQEERDQYCFYHIKQKNDRWVQKTVYLSRNKSPTTPLLGHVAGDGIYVIDQKGDLYINKAPLAQEEKDAPWARISTGLPLIDGSSTREGIFLSSPRSLLWIREGAWKKMPPSADFPRESLLYQDDLFILNKKGQVEKEGKIIREGVLDISGDDTYAYFLTQDYLVVEKSGKEIAHYQNAGYQKVIAHRDGVILRQKGGNSLFLEILRG